MFAAPFWLVVVTAGMTCWGGTWYDTACLVTNVRNFPNNRGTVVGLLKACVGKLSLDPPPSPQEGLPPGFILRLNIRSCPVNFVCGYTSRCVLQPSSFRVLTALPADLFFKQMWWCTSVMCDVPVALLEDITAGLQYDCSGVIKYVL